MDTSGQQRRNASQPGAIIAFFDIDRTLFDGLTGIEALKHFYQTGTVGKTAVAWTVFYALREKLNLMDPVAMVNRAVGFFAGWRREDLLAETEKIVKNRVIPGLYPEGLALLRHHRSQGHRPVLLTATSWDIAQPLAAFLEVDFIASQGELRGEVYTDRAVMPVPYGQGKVTRAREYCAAAGARLEQAWFYTDSHSDIPLLETVGHPVAVNPSRALNRHAAARGWPVLRFPPVSRGT